MFMQVRYTLFVWIPPALTPAERLWLGGEIARVGPAAFARVLKARMSEHRRVNNDGKVSFAEVIHAAGLSNQLRGKDHAESLGEDTGRTSAILGLVAIVWLVFTACVWTSWHQWRYFFIVFVVAPFFLSVTLGTMLLMHHHIDQWVRGLMDEYAKAAAGSAERKDIRSNPGPQTSFRKSDDKIVADFTDFIAKRNPKPDVFYDVSVLPDPKEDILLAIEREILRETSDARVEWLAVAASFLPSFQQGIGAKPLPWLGVDLADLKRSAPDLKEQAKIVAQNPDRERAEQFVEVMTIEGDQVQARTDAALRLREARMRPVRTAPLPQETVRPPPPLRYPIPAAVPGRAPAPAAREQVVSGKADKAFIRPDDLLPTIASYTNAALRTLNISEKEVARRTEHGDGGRFSLESVVRALKDAQTYPDASYYAKFHTEEDEELNSIHHGWCFDSFALINGREVNLLQGLRFAGTIDGLLSAFFASAILPTVGAYWHGLYDRDYQVVGTPKELNDLLFSGTLNESVGDTQAILRTPLGLRIHKLNGAIRCVCLCQSETEGLLDIEVIVSVDGRANEAVRIVLREPNGRTLY
jgi:hypothetical protein